MSEQFKLFASEVNAQSNTEEENIALFEDCLNGNNQAHDHLILGNQALVFKIAHQMPKLLDFEDLVQHGNVGLINSIEDYAKKRNTYAFGTHASLWIRTAMQKAIETSRIVHTNKWHRMSEEERNTYVSHESLNEKIGDGNSEFADSLGDDRNTPRDEVTKNDSMKTMLSALERLEERERLVVKEHAGIGCEKITLGEIAKKLNLTHERVRQIEAAALQKLKRTLED